MSDSVAAMAPAQSQPQPQPQPEPEPAAELEPPAEALALGTHQTEITAERSAVSEQTQPIQLQPGAPRQEHPPSQPPYGAPYGHRHQPQMADPSYAPYSMPHQQQQFDHYAPHPTRNDMSSRPPHRETHRRGGGPAESFKIFIAGLPTHTEEADLTDCFGQIGNVVGVDLKKGYGFVVSLFSCIAAISAVAALARVETCALVCLVLFGHATRRFCSFLLLSNILLIFVRPSPPSSFLS